MKGVLTILFLFLIIMCVMHPFYMFYLMIKALIVYGVINMLCLIATGKTIHRIRQDRDKDNIDY